MSQEGLRFFLKACFDRSIHTVHQYLSLVSNEILNNQDNKPFFSHPAITYFLYGMQMGISEYIMFSVEMGTDC